MVGNTEEDVEAVGETKEAVCRCTCGGSVVVMAGNEVIKLL